MEYAADSHGLSSMRVPFAPGMFSPTCARGPTSPRAPCSPAATLSEVVPSPLSVLSWVFPLALTSDTVLFVRLSLRGGQGLPDC